jgi:hypothetical protein
MTDEICWMVIAPLTEAELRRIACAERKKEFPFGSDADLPWTTARGAKHGALVSRLPGSQGADWSLAEIISKKLGQEVVYSVWFDPEMSRIVEWRKGKQSKELNEPPYDFARSLGFDVVSPFERPRSVPRRMVLVVEHASADEVRRVLGDDDRLRIEATPAGVRVSAEDGRLPTESLDLTKALRKAVIYEVEHTLDPEAFRVIVLQDCEEKGSFDLPPVDVEQPLSEIRGATTRDDILAKLAIDPALLGY